LPSIHAPNAEGKKCFLQQLNCEAQMKEVLFFTLAFVDTGTYLIAQTLLSLPFWDLRFAFLFSIYLALSWKEQP
jgi:hypothetical protein